MSFLLLGGGRERRSDRPRGSRHRQVDAARLSRPAGGRGLTVLSAHLLEAEAELPFAGLSDLLRPVLPLLDRLPGPQAGALSGALALGPAHTRRPVRRSRCDARHPRRRGRGRPATRRRGRCPLARRAVARGAALRGAPPRPGGHRDRARFARPSVARRRRHRPSRTDRTRGRRGPSADRLVQASRQPKRPRAADRGHSRQPLAILEALDGLSDTQLDGTELIAGPLPVGGTLGHSRRRPGEVLRQGSDPARVRDAPFVGDPATFDAHRWVGVKSDRLLEQVGKSSSSVRTASSCGE
jgi:hypothetical protein